MKPATKKPEASAPKSAEPPMVGTQAGRRKFIKNAAKVTVAVAATAIPAFTLMHALTRSVPPESRTRFARGLLRPPGALSEDKFLSTCIRCDRCRDACDARAIKIFNPNQGRNAGSPYILPDERACDLCLLCTEACPTGALKELTDKRQTSMGLAKVDKRLCVSWNGTGVCGACHTICPLKNRAITQELYNRPVIHSEECVGCGLCEEACIVKDRKAIQVFSERTWS